MYEKVFNLNISFCSSSTFKDYIKIILRYKSLMAKLINLQTVQDPKGKLTVFERLLHGGIKRVFFIHDPQVEKRGGHRHKETTHALICQSGSVKVYVHNGKKERTYLLNTPEQCLILDPEDWREMYDFSENTILLGISNTYYDTDDYITEPYGEI